MVTVKSTGGGKHLMYASIFIINVLYIMEVTNSNRIIRVVGGGGGVYL